MPYNEIDYSAWEPGQFYQLDHSQLDLWCFWGREQIRPWLSAVQDVRSRALVGWHIGPSPHQDAILCGLRMAFSQWAIPQRMRIDNGKDYTSRLLLGDLSDAQIRELREQYGRDWHRVVKRDAHLVPLEDSRFLGIVNELGIECTKAIPYSPWSKGITERLFGTVHDQFDKTSSTYCGNSTLTRPECLQQIRRGYTDDQRRRLRRLHGRDWKKLAVLKNVDQSHVPSIDAVREQFGEWVDLYHHAAHSGDGMNGASPLAVWSTATRLRRALEDELMFLLDMRGSYKVGPNGVRITVGSGAISYDGPCLSRLRGRKVAIALHNQEVSQAYAFDDAGDRRRYLGKLSANEKVPYGSDADDVREAIAEKRREQGAIKKAARLQVNRFKTSAQRLREHQRDKLTALRATGTLDSVPSSLRPSVPSIIPVPTGLEGVSTALRARHEGTQARRHEEHDYDLADLLPEQNRDRYGAAADDDDWDDFDPGDPEGEPDDDEEEEWEDFEQDDDDAQNRDRYGADDGDLYDD
jgi:transposase InsO family protein